MTTKRKQYLKSLAEEYGIAFDIVYSLADLFGENEDHDGLISSLDDLRELMNNQ